MRAGPCLNQGLSSPTMTEMTVMLLLLTAQLDLTPGEAHDNRLYPVLATGLHPRVMLLADRGYDADWIRALASQQGA